jgi:hypothetical protein
MWRADSNPYPMPQNASPFGNVIAFTALGVIVIVGLLIWWAISERRRGPVLPLLIVGTALSGIVIEPVFDNTLLYWYPVDGSFSAVSAYGRNIPWWLVLGYGWFFGGSSYVLWRMFSNGVSRAKFVGLVIVVAGIDQLANGVAGWLKISGFYGPQPFKWSTINVWFGIADATAAVVGATVLYVLVPHLRGPRYAWLLVTPTIAYGAVLGGITAPVTLGLQSEWTTLGRWIGGAGTIALACVVLYGCYRLVVRSDVESVLGGWSPAERTVDVASSARVSD